MRYIQPKDQSATYRRQVRQKVRNALGTSSDPAPNPEVAIRALQGMMELLRYTVPGLQVRLSWPSGEPTTPETVLSEIRAQYRR